MFLAFSAAACGGSDVPASNLTPTPIPATNHAPEVTAAMVTPATRGWMYLTTYTAHAEARDSDGDSLTFAWKIRDGTPVDGTTTNGGADIAFTARGFDDGPSRNVSPFTLTVTDAKGASTSVTVQFDNLYLRNERFRGRIGDVGDYFLLLNQTKAALTGVILDPRDREDGRGISDPAGGGTIDAQGNFRIRFKFVRDLGDLTLVGQVSNGFQTFQLTGLAYGSGFTGQRFTFQYDDGY